MGRNALVKIGYFVKKLTNRVYIQVSATNGMTHQRTITSKIIILSTLILGFGFLFIANPLDSHESSNLVSASLSQPTYPAISSTYFYGGQDLVRLRRCVDQSCATNSNIVSLGNGKNTKSVLPADGNPFIFGMPGTGPLTNVGLFGIKCQDKLCTTSVKTNLFSNVGSESVTAISDSAIIGANGFPAISFTTHYITSFNPGPPAIFCTAYTQYYLQCNNADCSQWTTEAVVSAVGNLVHSDVVLGANSLPVISFQDEDLSYQPACVTGGGDNIKTAFCTNASCSQSNLYTIATGTTYAKNSMVLSGGQPVFAYIDYTYGSANNSLVTATCTTPACTAFTTSTLLQGKLSTPVGIAIPSDGLPVIAYVDLGSGTNSASLRVLKCSNQLCSSTISTAIVDSGFSFSEGTIDITIGRDGNPVISYTLPGVGGAVHYQWFVKCNNESCTAQNAPLFQGLVSFPFVSIAT